MRERTKTDIVEFRFHDYEVNGYHGRTLEIFVNGKHLAERAAVYEATQEPGNAGTYIGMHLGTLERVPQGHFLGAPGSDLECGPSGKTVLLADQGCGEPDCWPLMAKITVGKDIVVWSDFEQPHRRSWDYDGLSFQFERTQYEEALAALGSIPSP